MEQCPICLETIKESKKKDKIKIKLSCNHELHFCCFRDLIYHKNNNYFIECPICRKNNTMIPKLYNNPTDNIEILCSSKLNCMKCLHKINGKRCQRKPSLLNYGYCYQHHKDILKKEKHKLMFDFMNLILLQRNNMIKKIYTFDIGKKLIIHQCNENSTIDELMYYFYRFINLHEIFNFDKNIYHQMYEYYHLEKPSQEWVQYCLDNKTIL